MQVNSYTVDARTSPTFKATLKNVDVAHTKDPLGMFVKATMPIEMVGKKDGYLCQSTSASPVSPRRATTRSATRAQVSCTDSSATCSLWLRTNPSRCHGSGWELDESDDDVMPAAALGRFGMGVNRFMKLKSLVWQYCPPNSTARLGRALKSAPSNTELYHIQL